MIADFGKNKNLSFPIQVEGKGDLIFGDNCKIAKNVNLGIAQKSVLKIDNDAVLQENSEILLGKNSSLEISNGFKLGSYARIYLRKHWKFGQDVKIETYCSIFAREPNSYGVLTIGNGSHIGDYTIIDVVDDVSIGKNVAIGPNCTLYTHDHIYTDKSLPSWKGGLISKPITIEDGAWIGSGVTILPGVKIGERAIVAAGSVVTKSVNSNEIYGGSPAKFIKTI
ncbi:acyltransferase [Winogradskyella sp. PG-2]|uniref:acyltransferase n=1 Tax=Winogradskyella sp. PG-2 TaxID=754409 RepID=UPI000458608E|nr:DapH/DapD/GlmU-related protein [Winogradskyella sp. PG-2]BAO76190.1 maltose O-acetyltransferase [Winogradskyella sp. PG-2]